MILVVLKMRDPILSESDFWDISTGENIEEDIYEQKRMEYIDLEDLPYENSYFMVVTEAHKKFLNKLEYLFSLQINDEWKILDTRIKSNELKDWEPLETQKKPLTMQIEIRKIKSVEETVSNAIRNSTIIYDDKFESIGETNQESTDYNQKSKILTNDKSLLAA